MHIRNTPFTGFGTVPSGGVTVAVRSVLSGSVAVAGICTVLVAAAGLDVPRGRGIRSICMVWALIGKKHRVFFTDFLYQITLQTLNFLPVLCRLAFIIKKYVGFCPKS